MANMSTINRLARAAALEQELLKRGNTDRAARLANKVFGISNGHSRWEWAGLYYKTALITGSWNDPS